jgi:glycosyltransferase involved in cell wall biosynthesis
MKRVKERLGARVHIVSAGDNWRPSDYGLDGVIENLGILDYADTARLYRESDLGAVFMLTRHPSYIPLELMACGCVTVTNRNTWTEWLLNDRHNCLLAPTTATAIADVIVDGLEDSKLRAHIRSNGIELVRSRYLDWNQQVHKVHDFLCDPEAILSRNEESVMKQGA